MQLGPDYQRVIWGGLFLLTQISGVISVLFHVHHRATWRMPIKLTKIEFDMNYFILYRDIFLKPLTYKREKKLEKLHISFFLKWIAKSNLNNNFKKLHAVSTWCYTKALPPCWTPPLSWQQLRFHRCNSAFAEQEDRTIVYNNNYLRIGVINIRLIIKRIRERTEWNVDTTWDQENTGKIIT